MHQYYNILLPRISYLFIYLELHFSSKSYWKGVVIISNQIQDSISRYLRLFYYTFTHINQSQMKKSRILRFCLQFFYLHCFEILKLKNFQNADRLQINYWKSLSTCLITSKLKKFKPLIVQMNITLQSRYISFLTILLSMSRKSVRKRLVEKSSNI